MERKFIETLSAIMAKDPKLLKMKEDEKIFKDEDFDMPEVKVSKKKEKSHTLKD